LGSSYLFLGHHVGLVNKLGSFCPRDPCSFKTSICRAHSSNWRSESQNFQYIIERSTRLFAHLIGCRDSINFPMSRLQSGIPSLNSERFRHTSCRYRKL